MPITATCPHCSESFTVPDSAGGKRFKCRACKEPMDVPMPGEEVPAAVPAAAPAEPEDEDDEDDEEDEDEESEDEGDEESDEEEEDEESEDEEEESEDEEEEDPKAKRRRERLEKKKGKDKGKKDKKGKDKKDKKKDKPKKEKKSFSAPKVEMGEAPDANETMGVVLGSIQRALHPSRVMTAVIGMAAVLVIGAVLGALAGLLPAMVGLLLMALVGLGMLVGFVVVAVAIAKVDLASLRGEEVPSPKEALLSSIGGGIGAVISALLLGLLVIGVSIVMSLIALLILIPYVGWILTLPLSVIFFFVFLAMLLGLPLVVWLMVPLASESGANPIAPLKGAIARVKAEPARILISYIMFIVLSQLILGVITSIGAAAAAGAGGTIMFTPASIWPGFSQFPGFSIIFNLFFGAGMAIVMALILSPFMSAFICAGCQEIHDHPRDDDE